MTLEDLIYQRLTTAEPLKKKLARFGGAPAVFYQTAPSDKAQEWKGKREYPRISYVVDLQTNPERQTSGVLSLDIWGDEAGTPPEELEPDVRAALCDVFLQPDEGPPFSLAWASTSAFEERSQVKPNTLVAGATVTFDVFAFPTQITTDPDPILAINEFVKDWAPEAVVIGKDTIESFYTATKERPAFYFRLLNLQSSQETNTVAWMNGTIAGHIFATPEARLQWLKALTDTLATRGEVTMLDTSPMFIQTIKADSSADRLTTGQLRLYVRFGILRRPKYAHTLMHAITT